MATMVWGSTHPNFDLLSGLNVTVEHVTVERGVDFSRAANFVIPS